MLYRAKSGIIMHVSTVPQSPNFFLSGDINRFMQFVLDHGAQMVRLLLPRFVGDSIREDGRPLAAGEENTPILFLEPSCYSMFIDDYREMRLPEAERVAARCFRLEEFLDDLLRDEPEALPFQPEASGDYTL